MRAKEGLQGTIYSNRDLKRLILPLIMEQLLAILVGMLDTVMISGVGEAAVSGVSLVDNINILVINIFGIDVSFSIFSLILLTVTSTVLISP